MHLRWQSCFISSESHAQSAIVGKRRNGLRLRREQEKYPVEVGKGRLKSANRIILWKIGTV